MSAPGAAGTIRWPVPGGPGAVPAAAGFAKRKHDMTRWTASALLWASGWVAAQVAPLPAPALVQAGELLPTRMVLCQRELAAADTDRQARLRHCLARRLEGERVVERQCKRQAERVRPGPERLAAQRACERQALAVPFSELPQRPPPLAPPKPSPDGTPTSAGTPPVQPAAGEQ